MAEETDTPIRSLADQRDELKRELQALIFLEDVPSSCGDETIDGEYRRDNLSLLDRAKVIRDLTEAFVRLGGDIELGTLLPPAKLVGPTLDVEELARTAWKIGNETAGLDVATCDTIAQIVREAAEATQ